MVFVTVSDYKAVVVVVIIFDNLRQLYPMFVVNVGAIKVERLHGGYATQICYLWNKLQNNIEIIMQ